MRVPIFEELILSDFFDLNLEEIFKSKKVGCRPLYITMYDLTFEETSKQVSKIEDTLKTLMIHPVFPYPLYIVTKFDLFDTKLLTSKDVNTLPAFFFKKLKRLKKKEIELLEKCSLLVSKINNRDIYSHIESINTNYIPTKNLYDLCKESYFYSSIIKSNME